MIKNMLSALGVVAVIGLLIYGLGWGLLYWQTSSTRMLQPQAATTTSAPVASGNDALDAVLGAATQAINGATVNRLEAQRERAAEGVQRSFMILMAVTTILAGLWTVVAWSSVGKVADVPAQRRASGLWLTGLLLATSIAGGLFWMTFTGRGPAAAVTAALTGGMVFMGFALAWLAYYLATAFSAPSVLRSSVPMANSIVPIDWSR